MPLDKRPQCARTSDVRLGANQQPFPDEEPINPEDVHISKRQTAKLDESEKEISHQA